MGTLDLGERGRGEQEGGGERSRLGKRGCKETRKRVEDDGTHLHQHSSRGSSCGAGASEPTGHVSSLCGRLAQGSSPTARPVGHLKRPQGGRGGVALLDFSLAASPWYAGFARVWLRAGACARMNREREGRRGRMH